ncbi:iron-containing alcohol dehydrogenase [Bengtsoniella intestinalis]|uniref:iron-containing alcohol dehydrogenase n=1 Tax=Bengtsoniella intestinalis TaxID=3073143 RepID=UPI00391F9A97
MNNFEFFSPTKVIFGKGVEEKVGAELKAWGATKVLIHFGGGSVIRSGLMARVEASLNEAGLPFVSLGGALPNPRLSLVYEGIELCRKEGVDFVLAIGGGSAVDSAKGIAQGVPYDGDVWDFYSGKAPTTALPHANIITLAATGSETSNSNVITKEEGMLKRGCNTDWNRPRFTLMNPELLYTLPPYQTSCGVVDILMHTFERYLSPNTGDVSEVTDRIAEAIMRTVIQYGPVCLEKPDDYTARSEVMWAGSISHNHMTGLGRKTDWASHQMEHELGGMYDVAHGAGLAAVWGSWARYVCDEDVMRFARFAVNVWGLNMNYDDPKETALAGIVAAEDFFRKMEMPVSIGEMLPDVTITDETIEELAVKCTFFGKRTIGGMKRLGKEDIMAILKAAL